MKSGLRAAVAVMTLMVVVGLAGCASTSDRYPQTPVPAPAAIDVSGRDVAAVAVRTIYADVPGGRIIGYHYDGADLVRGQGYKWDRAFENEVSGPIYHPAMGAIPQSDVTSSMFEDSFVVQFSFHHH